MSQHDVSPRHDIEQQNVQHQPRYWLMLSPFEAQELLADRVPPHVRERLSTLEEDLQAMLARKQRERVAR